MAQIDLFTPLQLGPLTLPNRIVMAPMTRSRARDGNAPTAMNAEYYAQRASAGLIVSEASQVSPQGVGYPYTPGIYSEAQVKGWKLVTDAVHNAGGRMFLQLWHVGRISHPSWQPDNKPPVSASSERPAGETYTKEGMKPFETPRALELSEIPGIVEQFRHGAAQAKSAGFDGVEIHGANGYLVDQFLRDGTNHRTDRYGGSVENRARFALEVVEAVAKEWGIERVGIRLSPTGTFNDMRDSNPKQTFGFLVKQLSLLQLAYVHLVEPMENDVKAGVKGIPLGFFRDAFDGILIANSMYTKERANAVLGEGLVDLVSFGVPFISNPDLPERFKQNAPLLPADPAKFYGGDAAGYTDYPKLSS